MSGGANAIVAGFCAALIFSPTALAQDDGHPEQPAARPAPAERVQTAPVIIDGEVLFRLRGVSSYPAKQRAAEVSERIRGVARDTAVSVSELRISESQDRTRITAGERLIVTVYDRDAHAEEMERRQLLAESFLGAISSSIERHRHERSGVYLRQQGAYAAVVLALLVAVLFVLRLLFRWMGNAVERYFQAHRTDLEARSFRLLSVDELRGAVRGGLRGAHFLLAFVLIVACLNYALSLFPWTRSFARSVTALLIDPLAAMWNGFVDAIPGLAFIAVLVVVTRYGLRLLRLFFSGIASESIQLSAFDRDWAWPSYRLVRFAVIAFVVVIAYPYIPGSDSEAFKGITIFLGLLMSLGAASMVANNLAGYALIYRRAFRVGDRIKVGDVVGDVVQIRQQVTHLRTPKNEEVTIPSSTILNSHVVNYSALARKEGLILHTTVGIGYETPWRQVEAMLIEAANRTEGLLREPAPFVQQKSLGDFCVTYEINVYTHEPQQMNWCYAALHRNILDLFNEYGVQIMTPAYEGDPQRPKVVAKKDWYLAPARPPAGGKGDE